MHIFTRCLVSEKFPCDPKLNRANAENLLAFRPVFGQDLDAPGDSEFVQDVAHMFLGGALCNAQRGSNLLVRLGTQEQLMHFPLPPGEQRELLAVISTYTFSLERLRLIYRFSCRSRKLLFVRSQLRFG